MTDLIRIHFYYKTSDGESNFKFLKYQVPQYWAFWNGFVNTVQNTAGDARELFFCTSREFSFNCCCSLIWLVERNKVWCFLQSLINIWGVRIFPEAITLSILQQERVSPWPSGVYQKITFSAFRAEIYDFSDPALSLFFSTCSCSVFAFSHKTFRSFLLSACARTKEFLSAANNLKLHK